MERQLIDVSAWHGLELIEPLSGGNRNPVWSGRLKDRQIVARQSRRSPDSLAWELDLLDHLRTAEFRVPMTLNSDDGRRSTDGVVVQTWIDGHPPSSTADWQRVADELQRLHRFTADYPQRPDCVTVRQLRVARHSVDADLDAVPPDVADRVLSVFDDLDQCRTAAIHGDTHSANIRIGADGSVGLLDWDESRVDLTWHDLSNLGVQVLDDEQHRRAERLSNAWEAVNGWTLEPTYARRRLAQLDDT